MPDFLQSMAELPNLLVRVEAQLEASRTALELAMEQLGNSELYERDAAAYLGVEPKTMYHYRARGLDYSKVGRIISYKRKHLDAWRNAGNVRRAIDLGPSAKD